MAGCAATTLTDPLICKFLRGGCVKNAKNPVVTVDEERINLDIWNLHEAGRFGLPSVVFGSEFVGLMLLYDVGEASSFERAKKLITVDVQQV